MIKNLISNNILMQLLSNQLKSKEQEPSLNNDTYGGWNNNSGNRGWEDWEIEDMNQPGIEIGSGKIKRVGGSGLYD